MSNTPIFIEVVQDVWVRYDRFIPAWIDNQVFTNASGAAQVNGGAAGIIKANWNSNRRTASAIAIRGANLRDSRSRLALVTDTAWDPDAESFVVLGSGANASGAAINFGTGSNRPRVAEGFEVANPASNTHYVALLHRNRAGHVYRAQQVATVATTTKFGTATAATPAFTDLNFQRGRDNVQVVWTPVGAPVTTNGQTGASRRVTIGSATDVRANNFSLIMRPATAPLVPFTATTATSWDNAVLTGHGAAAIIIDGTLIQMIAIAVEP